MITTIVNLVSKNPDYPATSSVSTVTTTLEIELDLVFRVGDIVQFPQTNGNTKFECRQIAIPVISTILEDIFTREYMFSSIGVPQ